MGDETENQEGGEDQGHDPALLAKAKKMGWVPKEEFRGDLARWTDAPAYVERGETMLPILQANNRALQNELGTLRGQQSELRTQLSAATEAIQALKEFNSAENLAKVKAQKAQIMTELTAAKKDEDVAREVELTDQLQTTNLAIKEAEQTPTAKQQPAQQQPSGQVDPIFAGWVEENPWFGPDRRRTSLANGIAQELRSQNSPLTGKAFLDAVAAEVEKTLGPVGGSPPPGGRVENTRGGAGGGNGNGGSSKGKSFASLPAEVQAICNRQAQRVVGKGRAFDTLEAWQSHYTKLYNEA